MYTNSQLLTKLRTKLRDTTDVKWTTTEKQECLDEALEDPTIAYYAEDTSLTASTGTQAYDIPTNVEKVVDIWIGTPATRVNPALWEQKYGKIVFLPYPPLSGTMSLTVIKKYSNTDSIPQEFANLILALACVGAYEMLMNKWSSSFLTNEISMAELQAGLAYWEKRVREERKRCGRISNRAGYKI